MFLDEVLPRRAIMSLLSRLTPNLAKKALYAGDRFRCPICETHLRKFYPFGVVPRPNALCPICDSLERHRMIWLYFRNETNLFSPPLKKMLHIAPEGCFIKWLGDSPHIDYLTADLTDTAMVLMDITDIQFPDNYFDVIYKYAHVLEHIPDAKKAMRELIRVLRPSDWAIPQVPLAIGSTVEDLLITDPKERERCFGQHDHVRVYGHDYKDRLVDAGFTVNVVKYLEEFSKAGQIAHGLTIRCDDIYLCTV